MPQYKILWDIWPKPNSSQSLSEQFEESYKTIRPELDAYDIINYYISIEDTKTSKKLHTAWNNGNFDEVLEEVRKFNNNLDIPHKDEYTKKTREEYELYSKMYRELDKDPHYMDEIIEGLSLGKDYFNDKSL